MAPKFTISGSEIGTILGFNPWETPMELYCRKMGLLEPKAETEAMRWGTAAEHVVARRYARETGAGLFPSVDLGYRESFTHPDYPWWTGRPDRKIEPDGLLEIKIVGERAAADWGDPPIGPMPNSYFLQCHWYMPLIGATFADLAVQIGNRDYRVYRIKYDPEIQETIRDIALEFLENHLIPGIPPPIDGSEGSRRYLQGRYPQEEEPLIMAPPEAERWIDELIYAKDIIARGETGKALAENKLREIIGNHAGIEGNGYKVTWRKNKDSQVIDWQAAFNRIMRLYETNTSEADAIIAQHTTIKPGPRVLRAMIKERKA